MDKFGPPSSDSPFDPAFEERLTALEQRNAAHDKHLEATASRGQFALFLATAGIGCAATAALLRSPLFGVVSLAAALVVFGLGSRVLATVNGVAATAGLLIVLVFVPALTEINHRTQDAVNSMVLTATASQPMVSSGPYLGEYDSPIMISTYVPIDIDFDDNGAVLPGP